MGMQRRALRMANTASTPAPTATAAELAARLDHALNELSSIAREVRALGSAGTQVAPEPVLLSPEEAAAVLGVGRSTIYRLIDEGTLRRMLIGRRALIPRADIDSYIADQLGEAS